MDLGLGILLGACALVFATNPRWRPVTAITAVATVGFMVFVIPFGQQVVDGEVTRLLGMPVAPQDAPLIYAAYDFLTVLAIFLPKRRWAEGLTGSNRLSSVLCCFIITNCFVSMQLKWGLSWPISSVSAYEGLIFFLNMVQTAFIVSGGLDGRERGLGGSSYSGIPLAHGGLSERGHTAPPVAKARKAKTR